MTHRAAANLGQSLVDTLVCRDTGRKHSRAARRLDTGGQRAVQCCSVDQRAVARLNQSTPVVVSVGSFVAMITQVSDKGNYHQSREEDLRSSLSLFRKALTVSAVCLLAKTREKKS